MPLTDTSLGDMGSSAVFKTGRDRWTLERLQQLSRQELLQLQANALRLREPELAALCAACFKDLPARGPSSSGAASALKWPTRLIPRSKAFEARGIWGQNARASWSGMRKSDGVVVFALWAQSVESREGGCSCLLWAPNVQGSRPWSDTVAGHDRLEHCKAALERGYAEGFLVQGERLEGRLPEDRARTVRGVDPGTLIRLRVEHRGAEYRAVWGKPTVAALATSLHQ